VKSGLAAAAALFFSNACYLGHAASGQASILWRRQPIEEAIADSSTDEKSRAKLRHVLVIRSWAADRLGLTDGAFRKFTKLDRKAVAWNVTASAELEFKARTWWFPIVGTVPYLGYFEEAKAERLAEDLRKEGWDVLVQEVAGYSTLGWFEDPLMSPQLEYTEWYLTRLVIHECTHATVWIPGSVDFNESFASFVEMEGALQFAREQEGEASESYRRKLSLIKESGMVREIFHRYALLLEESYSKPVDTGEKRRRKQEILAAFKDELQRRRPEFKALRLDSYLAREYNNADFLNARRYDSGEDYFRAEFEKCGKEWKCFLDKMRALKEEPANWKKPVGQ
jgi:predicted aminopeptidase